MNKLRQRTGRLIFAFLLPLSAGAAPLSPTPTSTPASSISNSGSPAPSSVVRARPLVFRGMIASVDSKTHTMIVAGKHHSPPLAITSNTLISRNGLPATIADVTADQEARGSYRKLADGSFEARTIRLGPLTEAEKAARQLRRQRLASRRAAASPSAAPSAGSPAVSPFP